MNSITNEREPIIFPYLPHDLGNLPLDLFKVIHSKLNPMHTELFATVSKTWQSNCNVIARDEFLLIKPFIDWLNLNLDQNQEETKSKLLACYDVNESFKSITKQIRAVLQELDDTTLKQLEKLSVETKKPKFFKDSLYLAAVDNSLKKIYPEYFTGNPNVKIRNVMHECISQQLAQKDYVSKLIEGTYMLTQDKEKNSTLGRISRELAKRGYFYKSIEVACMTLTDCKRNSVLGHVSRELFEDRLFDQTKKILRSMNNIPFRNGIITTFAKILRNRNEKQVANDFIDLLFFNTPF